MELPPSFSDQQVLQEDYDENYEPTEEGKQHVALASISVAMDTSADVTRHWFILFQRCSSIAKYLAWTPILRRTCST